MLKSKRSKSCDITMSVKKAVFKRDKESCILCGSKNAMPNAHYLPRSSGGLGIEQNIVTLCSECHYRYDMTTEREQIKKLIKNYLSRKYKNWNEDELIYKK